MKAESPEALIVGARAAGLTLAIDRREFNPLQVRNFFRTVDLGEHLLSSVYRRHHPELVPEAMRGARVSRL